MGKKKTLDALNSRHSIQRNVILPNLGSAFIKWHRSCLDYVIPACILFTEIQNEYDSSDTGTLYNVFHLYSKELFDY